MIKISELLANYDGETKYQAQFHKVYHEWQREPATMKEIEIRTGVDRANVCRYVAVLRKARLIAELTKRKCSITKKTATEFSTNQMLFPPLLQSSLFEIANND
jgi:hypothetical protein